LDNHRFGDANSNLSFNMAEATAADGQMKDLSISQVKKSKKDGAPKAAKKPQQQKKKVG
jgi:prolyl-tRNA synthetase